MVQHTSAVVCTTTIMTASKASWSITITFYFVSIPQVSTNPVGSSEQEVASFVISIVWNYVKFLISRIWLLAVIDPWGLLIFDQNLTLHSIPGRSIKRSRLCCPISKICMILLMDAKIWMVTLIIMFAVSPICTQNAIFKMSSVSP